MNDAVHKFAPLTDAERMAVPVIAEEHEDGELVSPIPSDAPDPTETHRTLGKPSQVWTYRDVHGAPRADVAIMFLLAWLIALPDPWD